jgi:hypothetical protein
LSKGLVFVTHAVYETKVCVDTCNNETGVIYRLGRVGDKSVSVQKNVSRTFYTCACMGLWKGCDGDLQDPRR